MILSVFSMRPNPATIAIIERRALIRECLARSISDELGCSVVSFPDVESWQKVSSDFRISLIVVSIIGSSTTLKDEPIDEVIRQLSQSENNTPIVVLSDTDDINHVTDNLRHGVRGHIPTGTSLNVAVKAMQLVIVGGVYVPASNFLTTHSLVKVGSEDEQKAIMLTERQNAVVDAVRQGKANKVIARELNISESTVKVHLHNVMKKLRVKNRTAVAVKTGKP
jgi:DNA-binding NarL/FixJ family response regulator